MAWKYDQELICCFTGHRQLPADRLAALGDLMDRVLGSLLNQGVRKFRTGGALGFDTLAALKVLDLRERIPEIRLSLYLPCRDQTAKWREWDRTLYGQILREADEVIVLREHYTHGCMLERNRAMVDGASHCVAFCEKDTGGSAYTVQYAKSKDLAVINLAEYLGRI